MRARLTAQLLDRQAAISCMRSPCGICSWTSISRTLRGSHTSLTARAWRGLSRSVYLLRITPGLVVQTLTEWCSTGALFFVPSTLQSMCGNPLSCRSCTDCLRTRRLTESYVQPFMYLTLFKQVMGKASQDKKDTVQPAPRCFIHSEVLIPHGAVYRELPEERLCQNTFHILSFSAT
jgi:hypothetical protein